MAVFHSSDQTPGVTMKSFPFMHLPKDIRLMVYEQLPVVTWHHRLPAAHQSRNKSQWWKSSQSHVVLMMTGICVQVMATCKQIREESASIIKRKIRTELCRQIPRIILEGDDFHPLLHHPYHRGVLVETLEWLLHRTGERECPADWDRKKDFEKWWISRQWFESEQNLRDREDRAREVWILLQSSFGRRELSSIKSTKSVTYHSPLIIYLSQSQSRWQFFGNQQSGPIIRAMGILILRELVLSEGKWPLTWSIRCKQPLWTVASLR